MPGEEERVLKYHSPPPPQSTKYANYIALHILVYRPCAVIPQTWIALHKSKCYFPKSKNKSTIFSDATVSRNIWRGEKNPNLLHSSTLLKSLLKEIQIVSQEVPGTGLYCWSFWEEEYKKNSPQHSSFFLLTRAQHAYFNSEGECTHCLFSFQLFCCNLFEQYLYSR